MPRSVMVSLDDAKGTTCGESERETTPFLGEVHTREAESVLLYACCFVFFLCILDTSFIILVWIK